MKYLGDAYHILGMRITRDQKKGLLSLSQGEYVHKVLEHFSMQSGRSVNTPLPAYLKLSKDGCPKSDEDKATMAKVPYASARGSLMYAMVATRDQTLHMQWELSADICPILERSIGKLLNRFLDT